MDSCVPSPQNSGFSQHNAFCSVTVNFAQPFEENVYYLTAIGRDFAAGSNQGLSLEGSEMNFGIKQQHRFEIGRASCRERVCQYVYISVVAVSLKKNRDKKIEI